MIIDRIENKLERAKVRAACLSDNIGFMFDELAGGDHDEVANLLLMLYDSVGLILDDLDSYDLDRERSVMYDHQRS